MLVNIWRVVRFRNPGDREDSFKEYFLVQEEAAPLENGDYLVEAGIVHPVDRTYKSNKYQVNKNVTYVIKFDK